MNHLKMHPKKCPDCNEKLPQAKFVKVIYEDKRMDQCWRIDCNCGTALTWSFGNIWKRSHPLPLIAAIKTEFENTKFHAIRWADIFY